MNPDDKSILKRKNIYLLLCMSHYDAHTSRTDIWIKVKHGV